MKARAATAIFLRRGRRIATARGPRPLAGRISPSSAASYRLGSSLSVIANPRVYDRVDDVDDDVHQDKGDGHDQGQRHDDVVVPALDRLEGETADAGDAEDRLGEEGPLKQGEQRYPVRGNKR